jgi:hypothetical protein
LTNSCAFGLTSNTVANAPVKLRALKYYPRRAASFNRLLGGSTALR